MTDVHFTAAPTAIDLAATGDEPRICRPSRCVRQIAAAVFLAILTVSLTLKLAGPTPDPAQAQTDAETRLGEFLTWTGLESGDVVPVSTDGRHRLMQFIDARCNEPVFFGVVSHNGDNIEMLRIAGGTAFGTGTKTLYIVDGEVREQPPGNLFLRQRYRNATAALGLSFTTSSPVFVAFEAANCPTIEELNWADLR